MILALILVGCGGSDVGQAEFDPESSIIASIEFSSPSFESGAEIPVEFTCDGDNISPALRWSDVPSGTGSIVVIVDDPDAPGGIFRHWSVYNIPSGARSLKANQPNASQLENSTRQGQNEFGVTGYGGPCPPSGQTHEYAFFIYALTAPLELEENPTPAQVSAALRGKVIGTGSFSGMYARR
jgi:hypothetical protein